MEGREMNITRWVSTIRSRNQISRPSRGHGENSTALPKTVIASRDSLRLLLFGSVLLLILTLPIEGGVNLKNGNFYISYTDIVFSTQHKLTRTYNSKATFQGMFGYGWGSNYETYLDVQGDGTVIVHENGGGAETIFRPPALSMAEIRTAVDRIIRAADQDGLFRSDTDRHKRRDKLLRDAEVRRLWWSHYVKKGLIEPQHIPPGTVYRSSERGQQHLLRTHDGFQRITQGSKIEEFDNKGRLVIIREFSDGAIFHLVRDQKGHISKIVNQEGMEWRIHMNDNGTVARIDTPTKKSSIYYYDGGHLIGSVDLVGNRYSYDHKYNMNAIGYNDGGRTIITYTGTEYSGSGMARSVTKRNRATAWYDYDYIYDRPDSQAYFTKVTYLNFLGDTTRVGIHEYWNAYQPDGTAYIKRIRITLDGDVVISDTTYDFNKRPIQKRDSDQIILDTTYDFNKRPIQKRDSDQIIRLSYNDRVNKISKLMKHHLSNPEEDRITQYGYDTLGNLVTITSYNNVSRIHVNYNKSQIIRAQIIHPDESGNMVMSFTYNDIDQLETTSVESSLGTIKTTYDADGNIQEISKSNTDNHEYYNIIIAMQIFQLMVLIESLKEEAETAF